MALVLPLIPESPMFIGGVMTKAWQDFFRDLHLIVGSGDITIDDIIIALASNFYGSDTSLEGRLLDLEARIMTLGSNIRRIEDNLESLFLRSEATKDESNLESILLESLVSGGSSGGTSEENILQSIYDPPQTHLVAAHIKNADHIQIASKTIAAGEITLDGDYMVRFITVDTSGPASEDLNTINGGNPGEILFLEAKDDARTVVVKDGANILMVYDFSLDNTQDTISLLCLSSGVWKGFARESAAA